MDGITNNPKGDLYIASLSLSVDEKSFRRIMKLAKAAQLQLALLYIDNPIVGRIMTTPIDEAISKRIALEQILRDIEEEAARGI